MRYDVQTYDLRPHSVAEAENRLAEACVEPLRDGDLLVSLHTEIGPLNQLVLIWARDDGAAGDRSRAAAATAVASIVLNGAAVKVRRTVVPTPG